MRWDDLNMGDKSRMIQLAVDSGITDLRTIRDVYNSYAEGGHLFWPGGNIVNALKNAARKVISPEARLAESYSSKEYTFDEAYRDARSKGQRTFFWNGNYYNTDYEGQHGKQYAEDVLSGKAAAFEAAYPGFANPELRKEKQEELDTYGITNEQTQNKNIVSQRLLDNIDPFGDYNLTQAIDAVVLNHKQRKTDAITQANNETHIAQLRNYLGYPAEPVEFVTPKGAPAKISKYTPTVGNSQEGKYYYTFKRNPFGYQPQNPERYLSEYKRLKSVGDKYLSGQFYEDALKHGLDYATKIADENMQAWSDYYDNHRDEIKGYGPLEPAFKITQETGSKEQRRSYGNAGGLGYFAVYNNPTYSSFYDLWDIGIGQGNNTNTFGIGKPFEYYDRHYHNPAEEPDIDKLYAEFSTGGKLHTKPENRGTLFAMGGNPRRRKTLIMELPEVVVTPQWLSYWDATPEQTRGLTNRNGKYNTTSMGDKGYTHFDTISARYKGLNAAMQRANFSDEEMSRLSPFLLTQLALEGGWVVDRPDNNFGGMMSGGKRIEFDTEDSFYDTYLKNLDVRWGDEYLGKGKGWRNAKTINEYADIINREDLGLHTKEAFDEYNRKHRDHPAYIYTPLWENNNTGLMDENKFGGIYDRALGNYELLMKRMGEWDKFARNNKIFAK